MHHPCLLQSTVSENEYFKMVPEVEMPKEIKENMPDVGQVNSTVRAKCTVDTAILLVWVH